VSDFPVGVLHRSEDVHLIVDGEIGVQWNDVGLHSWMSSCDPTRPHYLHRRSSELTSRAIQSPRERDDRRSTSTRAGDHRLDCVPNTFLGHRTAGRISPCCTRRKYLANFSTSIVADMRRIFTFVNFVENDVSVVLQCLAEN
jgi:hypothetical protein